MNHLTVSKPWSPRRINKKNTVDTTLNYTEGKITLFQNLCQKALVSLDVQT